MGVVPAGLILPQETWRRTCQQQAILASIFSELNFYPRLHELQHQSWSPGAHLGTTCVLSLHLSLEDFIKTLKYIVIYLFIFICMNVFVFGCIHVMTYLWRSEDNFWKKIISFPQIGPRYQTQVIRLGSKCLHQLIHVSRPEFRRFIMNSD